MMQTFKRSTIALLCGLAFALGATATLSGDTPLRLKSYVEAKCSPAISSNTLTIDLSACRQNDVALNANITTLTISNTVAGTFSNTFTIVFTADGTLRTITWPASVKWPGGAAPTMTSTNTKKDIISFLTYDGGTSWFGVVVGQNY